MLGGEAYRINWGTITAIIAFHWVIIFYLVWLLWERKTEGFSSPRAIRLDLDESILIVGQAEWLGQGVGVTVFDTGGGYEKQVAVGEVYNVQQDRLVQLKLYPFRDDRTGEKLQARLGELGNTGLSGVIVKPGPLRSIVW